jgi:hypothetical protein
VPAADAPLAVSSQAYAKAARQLKQLFEQHPELEAQAANDKMLQRWKEQYLSAVGYGAPPAPHLDSWTTWMTNLLWNVALSKCCSSHTRLAQLQVSLV